MISKWLLYTNSINFTRNQKCFSFLFFPIYKTASSVPKSTALGRIKNYWKIIHLISSFFCCWLKPRGEEQSSFTWRLPSCFSLPTSLPHLYHQAAPLELTRVSARIPSSVGLRSAQFYDRIWSKSIKCFWVVRIFISTLIWILNLI